MPPAPYPDLDPELWSAVADIAAEFPTPQHLMPMSELRARLEVLAARTPFGAPAGMTMGDWHIPVGGRHVRLRNFRPAGWDGAGIMLYMHGGGWCLGSIEGHAQVCADLAQQTGFCVVSIDYSLSPEHPYPVALDECLAAFEAIRAGAGPLPVGAALWVGGDSAGGNLALAVSLRRRDAGLPLPDGQLLIYPCTGPDFSRPSYTEHANAPFLTTALMRVFWVNYIGSDLSADIYACPATAPLAGLPPSVVLTAALDPLVDEGEALAHGLQGAGVDLRHRRVAGLIHGFLRFRGRSRTATDAFSWICDAIVSSGVGKPR